MTLDAMLDIAERAWSLDSPCYRCRHRDCEPAMDGMGEAFCRLMRYDGNVEDCPAVAAALDKEIDDECERAA